MKKLLVFILTAIILINNISVFAEDSVLKYTGTVTEIDDREYYLISEEKNILEDGTTIIERLYSSVDQRLRGASGSGWYRNEKEMEFSDKTPSLIYWVEGYFNWSRDKDIATVSNVTYGHGKIGSKCKIINEEVNYNSNQGFNFLWGRKYAYAEYKFTFVNMLGFKRDASVYIDVNVDGSSASK